MKRTIRLTLLLLLLPAAADAADTWPFGGGRGFQKLDAFNLGILGAKGMNADAAKPDLNAPPRGGLRRTEMQPGGDEGPERMRIDVLFPDGPAAKAGLKPGDVLVGVGRRRFSNGSVEPLAKALTRAEAGRGEVTLLVERDSEPKRIEVKVPERGRSFRRPNTGEAREQIVADALAWLAKRQAPDGGFAETLSGRNGAVVQTALAGLAWVGAGSDLEQGPYKDNLMRAVSWLAKAVQDTSSPLGRTRPGAPSRNQWNWGWAHAAIFFGELHKRTPHPAAKEGLVFCATRLIETQEQSGGWAHGPGGKNALGYLELNIVTGLALCALGAARANGIEIPESTVDKAEEFLEASSAGGGVGYSDRSGQKGQGNIGRTAGCWLGYRALGRRSRFGRSLGSWTRRNCGAIFQGHASLMQHILLAGVAAHALGRGAERDFWEAALPSFVLARAPDGSFQPRPWHETLSMKSNSDVTFGEVWTTAAWTIILVSDDAAFPGFPVWTGGR